MNQMMKQPANLVIVHEKPERNIAEEDRKINARIAAKNEAIRQEQIRKDPETFGSISENQLPVLGFHQQKFVDEFMFDRNQTKAYQRTFGCSYASAKTGGSKLMANPKIQEAIRLRLNQISAMANISQEEVICAVKEIARRCMQDEPVLDHEGTHLGFYRFDHRTALKAWALLGLYTGLPSQRKLRRNTDDPLTYVNKCCLDKRLSTEKHYYPSKNSSTSR